MFSDKIHLGGHFCHCGDSHSEDVEINTPIVICRSRLDIPAPSPRVLWKSVFVQGCPCSCKVIRVPAGQRTRT
ncbi:MAG: hypothetical protein FWD31_13620 [Planctomycetaceae bacterium]|nr:hypothetical protein [Planctomycetaceae bacterium]